MTFYAQILPLVVARSTKYQQRIYLPTLFCLDSADDLFSQQPKKSDMKGSGKKDAIENVFDNDNDFLDAISKDSTSSDTAGDKYGQIGPPDDAPVDLVCVVCVCACVLACVCVCVVNLWLYASVLL